ncbi:hypothetical protein BpHYR1_001329 [Brachionus plicatilis]|uniref:Uncharacterized protein n=1 Tax=Brachionus plicatilis TaxID=10195 RepID=A0A3M7PI56_BRAPC|nr:hypothetical protein BpHYR1_001329 [Brachionus plicatilis]
MSNLHLTCAYCLRRLDSNEKLKKNKVGITSAWLKAALFSLGIEWKKYKSVCCDCHKKLSQFYPNKSEFYYELLLEEVVQNASDDIYQDPIEETIHINQPGPSVTTDSVCLDYASIDDKRCHILTGLSKNDFEELYQMISCSNITGNVLLINALGFYLTKLRTGVTLKEISAFLPIASYDQIKRPALASTNDTGKIDLYKQMLNTQGVSKTRAVNLDKLGFPLFNPAFSNIKPID